MRTRAPAAPGARTGAPKIKNCRTSATMGHVDRLESVVSYASSVCVCCSCTCCLLDACEHKRNLDSVVCDEL